MSWQRHVMFWVAAFAVVALALWLLADILMPFIAGLALAYLLDPPTRRLQRLGMSRTVAAIIVLTVVVLLVGVLLVTLVPILSEQLSALLERLPSYANRLRELLIEPNRVWLDRIFGSRAQEAGASTSELVSKGAGWLATLAGGLWSGGKALFSLLSLLVIMPIVAFYLLADWDRMIATVDGWVPVLHRETVRGLAREIDRTIAGFVRGQALVCFLLGSFYAVALALAGLNFGVLIGILAGALTFIPYVGSLAGLLAAGTVAIAQFWPNYLWIGVILGIFLFGQAVEGNVLTPKIVGDRVGLHPVWLMFALLAFGYLFGFVGLLVAVPLAAAVGVLLRFGLRQYLASPLYTGKETP